ncbi:MAG: hypothetical protein HY558_02210 [Euryarchaeota archaeon]|nr:hypothetical protein [Euryarchaeota archaeon]
MEISDLDPGAAILVEQSRARVMVLEDPQGGKGVPVEEIEVEVMGRARGGREVRGVLDLFAFKALVAQADRQGLPVSYGPSYVHRTSGESVEEVMAHPEFSIEKETPRLQSAAERETRDFDIIGLVREMLRREADLVGPAYG